MTEKGAEEQVLAMERLRFDLYQRGSSTHRSPLGSAECGSSPYFSFLLFTISKNLLSIPIPSQGPIEHKNP